MAIPGSPSNTVDPRAIERMLRRIDQVLDCALVARRDVDGESRLVAYLVTASPSGTDLESRVAALVGDAVACVEVSSLPRTPSGAVDEAQLTSMPVIDAALVQRAEDAARALGADRASAILQDRVERRPALHLWDLVRSDPRGVAPATATSKSPAVERPTGTGVPAVAHGARLGPMEPDLPTTLAASLERAARAFPDHGLRYVRANEPDAVQAYPQLLEEARRVLAGLRRIGLSAGDAVLLQLPHHQQFFEVFWGCVIGGFVPVPISPAPAYANDNSAAAKLLAAWNMFGRALVVADGRAVEEIRSFLESSGGGAARVADAELLKSAGRDEAPHTSAPDDVALMMLTSGSTGQPKGVMLSHANLLARAIGSRQMNGFSSRDITLNWMALDHVAGIIYFHLRDVFLGSRQIHVPTELILQDPLLWLDLVDRHRATVTFAPNFAFGLVNDRAREIVTRHWDLSSMRFVLNGGEAIVARTARRFLTLLAPHRLSATALHPAWGMSETSSGTTYSDRFSLEATTDDDPFVEVGAPIPGLSMRIVDPAGVVVDEGTVGRLQVKGTVVTRGYYGRPDLNATVFTEDGWFDTGDLATVRDGQLAIAGREKDDIVINGVKYYSHDIEGAVEEVAGVATSFTAACAVRRRGADSEELAIFFVPEPAGAGAVSDVVKDIRRAVLARVGVSPQIVLAVTRNDIPKTAIGKIQRADVRRRFEAGGFDGQVKALDIDSENANTVPDWFFRVRWRRKPLTPAEAQPTGVVVVFDDGDAVAGAVETALAAVDAGCVHVEPGIAFEKLGPLRYRVRPREQDDYAQLLASIGADGYECRELVHLWGCAPLTVDGRASRAERDRSATSLVLLARALAQADPAMRRRLLVVSSRAQAVGSDDRVQPDRSAVAGIAKSIGQEMPTVSVTHVDSDIDTADVFAATLVDELRADGVDTEVAYRSDVRLVAGLERMRFAEAPRDRSPIVAGGFYVVAGGLGGVGLEISRWLVTRFCASVLVLGRTPIDESPTGERNGERVRALEALGAAAAAAGTSVEYAAVDITDADRVHTLVAAAKARAGRDIDGVFHVAGVFNDRLIIEESAATLDQALAAKLDGSVALAGLLDDGSGKLFASFSSVAGFLGRFGGAAYSASSCAQEAVTRAQRRRGIAAYAIAWSTWDDLGVNRGFSAEQGRARGYYAVSKTKGVNSLLVALSADEPLVLVGLDTQSPALRPRVFDESAPVRVLRVFATSETPLPRTLAVEDAFGCPIVVDVERTAAMPLLESGEIDLAALAGTAARRKDGRRAPETELERLIARTWQDVLNVSEVDAGATFFDLGGTSLLLAQVYSRLRSTTPAPLSMTEMFRYPTVATLAAFLDGRGEATDNATLSDDGDRGRGRRALIQRTRRRTAPALS